MPDIRADELYGFILANAEEIDGDGKIDKATLYAVVPGQVECGPAVAETSYKFQLTILLGSGTQISQPFADCKSIDCHLLDGSDFDGDGRSELPVTIGPGSPGVATTPG